MSGSSSKELLNQAIARFGDADYAASVEAFTDLFQRPRVGATAARKYLELFAKHASLGLLPDILDPFRLAQSAIEIIERRRSRRTLELLQKQMKEALKAGGYEPVLYDNLLFRPGRLPSEVLSFEISRPTFGGP